MDGAGVPMMTIPKEVTTMLYTDEDLYIKQYALRCGEEVTQHRHPYDHVTLLAHGSVMGWTHGTQPRVYQAPTCLRIPKDTEHYFQAIADETVLYCIHSLRKAEG